MNFSSMANTMNRITWNLWPLYINAPGPLLFGVMAVCMHALSVHADAPRIAANRHPQSQCIINGQSASLSVTAQGTGPFSYQWRFNGADLPDKTNSSLSIRPLRPEHGGDYQVAVANADGAITSRVARLHVLPTPSSLVARVYSNSPSQRLPYRLWVPTNHLNQGPLPLVIFLHGAGERGSDNLLQLTGQPHALSFVSYQNQETYPCFFAAPQCPNNGSWNDPVTMGNVGGMISNLLAQYSIDTNRLYLTGLSLGGYGTWALIYMAPSVFAAGAPICGGASTDWVPAIQNTPLWVFHSSDDGTVPVQNSRTMVEALRQQGSHPIYTEYASAGHFSWVPAYSTQNLIDWMMAQRLGQRPSVDPQLTLPPAYCDRIARAPAGYFNLQGQVAAFGETITNIVWTNLLLRAGGPAVGNNAWSVPNVPLVEHQTNVVIVTARTTSWAPQYAGTTTITRTVLVRGLPPLQITLQKEANQLRLAWTGGEPPYLVQTRQDAVTSEWLDAQTNALSPWALTDENQAAFYRVLCP